MSPKRITPLIDIYKNWLLEPMNNIKYFIMHSLDDLVEDIVKFTATGLSVYFTLEYGLLVTLVAGTSGYIVGNHLGDGAGDMIDKFTASGKSNFGTGSANIFASLIEDAIEDLPKFLYYAWHITTGFVVNSLIDKFVDKLHLANTNTQIIKTIFHAIEIFKVAGDFAKDYTEFNEYCDQFADQTVGDITYYWQEAKDYSACIIGAHEQLGEEL
jgi:hypothetical protein